MSHAHRRGLDDGRHIPASVFAALGDETRLSLIAKLCLGEPHSISQLTEGSPLTRQAITKHLRVLESVGIVHSVRSGRESLFEFDPEPLDEMQEYLALVSAQWDQTLSRLKSFVEGPDVEDAEAARGEGGSEFDEEKIAGLESGSTADSS